MDLTRIEEEEAQLSRADYHIQRAQENIERQKELVQELDKDGHDTSNALRLLATLKDTLVAMQEHRQLIIEEIARLRNVPGIG
jgi:hypothetical protein